MKRFGFIKVCGSKIPIQVGSSEDHKELVGCYGLYDANTCTIWIHVDTPKTLIIQTLVHEVLHAMLNLSGAIYSTAAAFGLDRDDSRIEAWEESFVRLLTPHITETFGDSWATSKR